MNNQKEKQGGPVGSDAAERKKGMTKSKIYHGRDITKYNTTSGMNYTSKESNHA